MTDIVKELRAVRIYGVDVHHRAADEIEKLRAQVSDQFKATFAKLRETLGPDLAAGGGLVGILCGIEGLQSDNATLRALLVDIDKSDLLEHRSECRRRMWNDEKCSCDFDALQERINAATAAKEEPK